MCVEPYDERAAAGSCPWSPQPATVDDRASSGIGRSNRSKEYLMGDGTSDKLKGHVKEAGGDLTGDKDLKNEGKVDRASGSVKDKVGDVSDKAKDKLRKD